MNIGKAIKLCRVSQNMSQSDFATLADISVSYLSLLERNKRDVTFSTLEKIAKALDVSLITLVFLASTDKEKSQLDNPLQEKLAANALKIMR